MPSFPALRPLPLAAAAAAVATLATLTLAAEPERSPARGPVEGPQALAAHDATRRSVPSFAGAAAPAGYPDVTPGPGDRGVPDAEPIGYPQVVAAAAEPPRPAPDPGGAPDGSVWDRLAACESGGNWASTVGRYEGGLQFHPGTWDAYRPAGYPGAAYEASRAQQIAVAERVLAAQGWGAWPACSRELGLR